MSRAALLILLTVYAVDIAMTILLIRKRARKAYLAGWDHAVLAQRAGLHTLLTRERK